MKTNGFFRLSSALNDSLAELVERVQRSLVIVHSGRRGFGAGVIWRRDGIILTNHHVVAGARRGLSVTLEDGSQHPARLLAEKPEVDLAALRIQAAGLPAAWIADGRSLRPGQMVLAVGHPWGQPGFVTLGIISALEQTVARDGQPGVPIIRSDVKLAPGNSGGPLVNAAGAVVGINTMIIGGDQGVAIPSHVAHSFILSALGEQPGESRREAPAAEAAKEAVA